MGDHVAGGAEKLDRDAHVQVPTARVVDRGGPTVVGILARLAGPGEAAVLNADFLLSKSLAGDQGPEGHDKDHGKNRTCFHHFLLCLLLYSFFERIQGDDPQSLPLCRYKRQARSLGADPEFPGPCQARVRVENQPMTTTIVAAIQCPPEVERQHLVGVGRIDRDGAEVGGRPG